MTPTEPLRWREGYRAEGTPGPSPLHSTPPHTHTRRLQLGTQRWSENALEPGEPNIESGIDKSNPASKPQSPARNA